MRHCEILLPFGLPPSAMAPDLLRNLHAPALSTLLAKAAAPKMRPFDPFALCLPHELWLAQRQGLIRGDNGQNSPPLAASRMQSLGMSAEPGTWFLLHPVHIHIARDHLVLTDRRRLPLIDAESRAFFDTALAVFENAGKTLRYGSPDTWFVRADDWANLQTASPDAACGHNIDIWMPKGEGERAWRKLQNEVQMEWHENPVNNAREARRDPSVNSLWLWGASNESSAGTASPLPSFDSAQGVQTMLASAQPEVLTVLDNLSETALAEEWGGWLESMQQLDQHWFAPMLDALKNGKIAQLTLVLSHNTQLREFNLTKSSFMKFWARPSLNRLAP